MELADPRQIEQLKAAYDGKPCESRRTKRVNSEPERYEPPRHVTRRCKCGTCSVCKDNARWERIFNEKFRDPSYYDRGLAIHYGSPLHQV